jgi:hypothetical protein
MHRDYFGPIDTLTQKFEVGAFVIEVLFRCENEQKLEAISGVSSTFETRNSQKSSLQGFHGTRYLQIEAMMSGYEALA